MARKDNSIHQAYNAVLHASNLGEEPAIIEHARLVWKEGHQRKAIRSLQGAIEKDVIGLHWRDDRTMNTQDKEKVSLLGARANLLLAKWLDKAAQTSVTAVRQQYQRAAQLHHSWERGHYYLGRHYNKLLEEQKALPRPQQSDNYVTGELARLVCENYLRSLNFGTKYIYQTLPRIITLWLELGMRVSSPNDEKFGNKDAVAQLQIQRKNQLSSLHGRFDKYFAKMPAYIFYTALPQIIARIAHPNQAVYKHLQQIIVKVIVAHPRQSLWTLLAVVISTQDERRNRGGVILNELRKQDPANAETGQIKIMDMVNMGQMLSQKLLFATEAGDFQGNRTQYCSLSKDLGFNQKSVCPNPLTVPVESTLMATLPTITSNIRTHSAFATEAVTIESFKDSVMIMSSLQKPRKIDARGSDGKLYSLLLKPKDDLRKDQRLMEFNSMINRSFKRDDAASKRQLYIKTYAVTPLNEECGIIEWVNGLKTLRDIVLNLYTAAGVVPNYAELKSNLQKAFDAENETERHKIYAGKVISRFPPIFHKWFAHQFPEPSAWFNARLRYTRSCAVMSMIGTILGLGDRHGENILFEEGNGGTFHVDFNCLFDKGLSFAQPERVPFRLTHNMIDAMGIYGYEGPFRVCAELTLKLLRQHEETLMTILEAFVYDPTLDLLESSPQQVKRKGRKKADQMTPHGVLEVIRRKLRGGVGEDKDSQGLGVEGQVDALIAMATDERNLAGMYIGWCAFI